MTFAIPAPPDLAEQFAAALDGVTFTASDGTVVTLDARDPATLEGVISIVTAMGLYELYLYLATIAREVMPDTAVDWLPRHAAIWGRPREAARFAVGTVTTIGLAGTQIPAGTQAKSGSGLLYATTAAAVIGSSASLTIPMQAVAAGGASNLAANAQLSLVSAIAGLTMQTLVVQSGGMAGGTDIETIASWRAGILNAIRTRPGSGKASDYVTWAIEAGAAFASVIPRFSGAGTVGVVIAMAGPAVPSAAQLAAVQAYIAARSPVEATVIVVAATLLPVDHVIAINPDTTANRAAVQAQLDAAFAIAAGIGTPWYASTDYNALSSVGGLTSYRITTPASDTAVGPMQLPVMGNLAWTDPY